MSINPKLSSLVSGQLPEFIREDYQTFVAFLEAYYEYLETNVLVDIKSTSDIDTTFDSFVKYFKDELALNFPSTLVDERFLLPKLKEVYTAKGTEASYRLLFRILYNKEIDLIYPSKQMLRVSDGKWHQDISVFVKIFKGNITDIIGQFVTISTSNKNITVFIDRYQTTVDSNVYEVFITGGWTGEFYVNDILKYSDVFIGVIQPTTVSVSVIQPGKTFRVGQTYTLTGGTSNSVIQVTRVDNNGGILSAQFVSYGIGYLADFSSTLAPTTYITAASLNYFTKSGTNVTIADSVSSFSDTGYINRYNYASTSGNVYVDTSYVGEIITTFSNTSSSTGIDSTTFAVLSIKLGSYTKYPGYYISNDGFLSDNMYIQDSKYYQAFSYVIKISEQFESYKSVVKNLLHPSGTELYGEYEIGNVINYTSSASSTISVS